MPVTVRHVTPLVALVTLGGCHREPEDTTPAVVPVSTESTADTGPDVVYVTTFDTGTTELPTGDTGVAPLDDDDASSWLAAVNSGLDAASGDFDLDGVTELVSNDRVFRQLLAWDLDGTTGRREPQIWLEVGSQGFDQMFAEDMDGDGNVDLVAREVQFSANLIHIYPSPFDVHSEALIPRPKDKRFCIADIDGDGFQDVLTHFRGLEVYYGPFSAGEERTDFDASFDISAAYVQGVEILSCPGDLTGDGLEDVLVWSGSRYGIVPGPLLRDEGFQPEEPWMLPHRQVETHSAVIHDIDGAGRSAIVVFHSDQETWERRLDFVLTPVTRDPASLEIVSFSYDKWKGDEWAWPEQVDLNGDGYVDAQVPLSSGPSRWCDFSVRVILGPLLELPEDDPLQDPALIITMPGWASPQRPIDADLDGRPDLIIGLYSTDLVDEGFFVYSGLELGPLSGP